MKEPIREANRWFLQSEDDLRFVKSCLEQGDFFDKGCFIAQQAAEKALKACAYASGERRVLGHSLFELAEKLFNMDDIFKNTIEPSKRLDRFYIPTRYPNGLPGGSPYQMFDNTDLKKALSDLEVIINACRYFLQKQGVFS